jgi:dCMP deaminase
MSYLVNDLRTKADSIHRIILGQCYREAINSPDTSTQLGAVIVDKGGIVRYQTLVHNGFVDGWIVTEADYERPRKYVVTEHAERRAIYKAAKAGIALDGSTLYATCGLCPSNCRIWNILSCTSLPSSRRSNRTVVRICLYWRSDYEERRCRTG